VRTIAMIKTPTREKFTLKGKLIRRKLRRIRKQINPFEPSLKNSPIIFANSFPKSGTHLLIQIMKGFSIIGPAVDSGLPAITTFDGYTGRQKSEEEIITELKRLFPGDIAYGHLHADPKISDLLCQKNFFTVFIIRDPRDVAVSHVHYLTDMEKKHIHHDYYQNILHTFDDRLETSIKGINLDSKNNGMPNIYERFSPYLGWLDLPQILTIQYEELITQQETTLKKILSQVIQKGFQINTPQDNALRILSDCINPETSPTFRSGIIGSWKLSFNDHNKDLFKQISGDLLIKLGYEENTNW
jgi:sulfotransferase 6B1